MPATDYVAPLTQFKTVSWIMGGEILDSEYVEIYSTDEYLARTDEYLGVLDGRVDIWEVGNEVNGEWLGDTDTVVAKVSGAYDKVKAAGKKTELTLYYNAGCFERADHEMFTWTEANIPARMKTGLDYVFISYWEDDCNGLQPDWQTVFTQLSAMFPNSDIGIAECGSTRRASRASYVTRYYGMSINVPRYVGGIFSGGISVKTWFRTRTRSGRRSPTRCSESRGACPRNRTGERRAAQCASLRTLRSCQEMPLSPTPDVLPNTVAWSMSPPLLSQIAKEKLYERTVPPLSCVQATANVGWPATTTL